MRLKKKAALLMLIVMLCSLFAGVSATTYAADKGSIKLEVYKPASDGNFGNKLNLATDKVKEGDTIIVAVQAYKASTLFGPKGLDTLQLQLLYDSTAITQQFMKQGANYIAEETLTTAASGRGCSETQYAQQGFISKNSVVGSPDDGIVDMPSAEAAYDKETRWYNLCTNETGAPFYTNTITFKKVLPDGSNWNNQVRIIMNATASQFYSDDTKNAIMQGFGSGEDKKLLYAFSFKVKSLPAEGIKFELESSPDDALAIQYYQTEESTSKVNKVYSELIAERMEEVAPVTVQCELPASAKPTAGNLTDYNAGSRNVTVTAATGATVNVYADAAKTTKLGTGTAGTAIALSRGSEAGTSATVKALNLGEVYVTATEAGKGESEALKVSGTKRPNETMITTTPTATASAVKVGAPISDAKLPAKVRVPFTYVGNTGAEPGGDGDVPVTWAWKEGHRPTTAGTPAVAVATYGALTLPLKYQDNINNYIPEVNVTVSAAEYTAATATSPATETAQSAYAKGWTTEAALKAWLDANVKVNTTKEGNVTATESTAWTKTAGDFSVKGGTYTYESGAFGSEKATITVKVTPVKGELGWRATKDEISVTALDEELNVVERPTTNEALIALMPAKAFVNYGDAASPSQGEADLTWTVESLSSDTGALTDGAVMGTLIRTVTLPADLAWLTVDTNPAPDKVTVKAALALGGVRATAANMPGTDNDMIRVTADNQQIEIMRKLVAKEGAVIEVYDSKEATEPSITHTVTAEEATQALFTTDNFKTAGSTRYVGINYKGMKTPNESRLEMAVPAEPAVTLTGTATSVKEGATITETAQLNGTWTFVADSQTWASSADATLTATANADKSTATLKGIAAGTATVTFTAKVEHPFKAELIAANPDATNTEVEVTATKAYSVTKKATPPTPTNPTTPGTRPGTSGNHGTGGVVIVPSEKQYFIDIDNITWAKDKINALAEKGIVEGVADKIFAPNNTVTRAEFAKMIVGAFGIYDTNATMDFVDTVGAENEWYYKYVASAAKRGIILGYEEDHTFRPTRTISREEMCAIVVRACKATGRTLVRKHQPITFNDDASIMGYAKESVDLMTSAGIIDGMGENMFVPKGSATRAQAAKIIYDVTIG